MTCSLWEKSVYFVAPENQCQITIRLNRLSCKKWIIALLCLYLSACIISATTGQIFCEIWNWTFLLEFIEKIQIWLKVDKNIGHCTWRTMCVPYCWQWQMVATQRTTQNRIKCCVTITMLYIYIYPPRWCLHLIVVRGFEYVSDPQRYTSGSVPTGRASLAWQVKG